MTKTKKLRLSEAERARRSRQAKLNFKLIKKTRKKVKHMARRKQKNNQMTGMLATAGSFIAPIVYGAVRGKISNAIKNSPIGAALPVSNYTDEATMLILNELAKKVFHISSIPVLGGMSRALKQIELASIGQQLATDFWK